MELAVDLTTAGQEDDAEVIGCVYVQLIGIDLYKVGKAKDYEERMKAHRTMSVEHFSLYALIETQHYGKVETYLKHLLLDHRWTGGEGTEIYKADPAVIDEAVAAARSRADLLPRMAEAAALKEQVSDETVLTPDEAMMALHQERRRVKRMEWWAKHEGERIDTEIQLIMGSACELAGVATFRSGLTHELDRERLRIERPDIWEAFQVERPTRPFNVRW